jgi:2-C-methyl-D-erythritol 4-phosphate cytidylyltransferase
MPLLNTPAYWFVVPAAGIGARMCTNKPKQYLTLGDKTILEHTLQRILAFPNLAGVVVPLSRSDEYWTELTLLQHPLVHTIHGGDSRAQSVLNGLDYLADKTHDQDWVLVHDAARPCVTIDSIQSLCSSLAGDAVGGILAVPVCDTLKKIGSQHEILSTVDRSALWQAQTPQLFRFKLLRDCLREGLNKNAQITDEASAVELCGYEARVVLGRADNIKITRPEDLILAEFILQQQEKSL